MKSETGISGMNRVWVTRSLPGALRTGERLEAMGHMAMIAPLLEISVPDEAPPELPQEAILVLTSGNGVRALSGHTERRHWPVVTVGNATANLARQKGFEDVISANGTSDDVVECIRGNFKGDSRPVIHISGAQVRGEITQRLAEAGFTTRRDVYYVSLPVTTLPDIDVTALSHVLLYSPMGAQTLRQLAPGLEHVSAISISAETDAALAGLKLCKRLVASAPHEKAMLTMLD